MAADMPPPPPPDASLGQYVAYAVASVGAAMAAAGVAALVRWHRATGVAPLRAEIDEMRSELASLRKEVGVSRRESAEGERVARADRAAHAQAAHDDASHAEGTLRAVRGLLADIDGRLARLTRDRGD